MLKLSTRISKTISLTKIRESWSSKNKSKPSKKKRPGFLQKKKKGKGLKKRTGEIDLKLGSGMLLLRETRLMRRWPTISITLILMFQCRELVMDSICLDQGRSSPKS